MPLRKPHGLILMADDDEDDCLIVRDALGELSVEADIRFAHDGQMLMDYLSSCARDGKPRPDLIMLDLNMPNKSGREALREMKANTIFKSIPVVIFSTSSDQADINFCYKNGASSYIKKNLSFTDIIEVMRLLCGYWFSAVSLPTAP